MFIVIFFNKNIGSIVANTIVTIAFFAFAFCHYQGCQKCEEFLRKRRKISVQLNRCLNI